MENRVNDMGSEVVEGYRCKPKNYDANRPIMHYKSLIFICNGERCKKAGKIDKASYLRDIIKDMGLNRGKNRIKVTRTGCYGACRFRQVCHITENTQINGNPKNNSLWLKHTHNFKESDWRRVFTALSEDVELKEILDNFISIKLY